jgi:DNA-binding beta-propeller fold protein YncE
MLRHLLAACAVLAVLVPAAARAATPGVYVSNFLSGNVSQYSLLADGLLSPDTPATVTGGNGADALVVGPDGSSVYVANQNDHDISQYTVGPGGLLTPKSPATVQTGTVPDAMAISPDGGSVYVVSFGDEEVYEYNAGVGGALSPKSSPAIKTGHYPQAIAISPDGDSLYVVTSGNGGAGDLEQYNITAGGELAPKTPATVDLPYASYGIAVSPDGGSVYVASGQTPGVVTQFNVGPGGTLSPKSPATVPTGDVPYTVVVSRDAKSVYVVSHSGDSVSQYDVGAGGLLTAKSPPSVPAGLLANGFLDAGSTAFVANEGNDATTYGDISQYTVGPTGALSAATPSTIGADNSPEGIAIGPEAGPKAALSESTAAAGSPSSFDGSASTGTAAPIARYAWNFGDGSRISTTSPTTTHVYSSAGSYTVTLTVTDSLGCSAAYVYTGRMTACFADAAASASQVITVATPSNAFSIESIRAARSGVISVVVGAHAPGSFSAVATFVAHVRRTTGHGRHRHTHTVRETVTYGSTDQPTSTAFDAVLTIVPRRTAWRLVQAADGAKVSVALVFAPTDGSPNKEGTSVHVTAP